MTDYTHLLKIVLAGRTRSGKSSILSRYCDDAFRDQESSTIGVDFKIKVISAFNQNHKLQIWDTSGVERFRTITANYYRGASLIVLVYAVNDRDSFAALQSYYQDSQMQNGNAQFTLIGNKRDATDRVVSEEEGRQFAAARGMPYFETSAKDGSGVNDAMQRTAEMGISKLMIPVTRGERLERLERTDSVMTQAEMQNARFFHRRNEVNSEREEFNRKSPEMSSLEYYAPLLVLALMLTLVAFKVI